VLVLALDDRDRVPLIRQYRHAIIGTRNDPKWTKPDVDGEPPVIGAQQLGWRK
jgi:hypothetical protein